jgi:putative ABC transport system ATP-binding protein
MINVRNLTKSYRNAALSCVVLRDINLTVREGEFVAIMGHSGSGKSTLLNVLGILDAYDTGEYFLNGVRIGLLSEAKSAQFRNKLIGFVFQSFNLLPYKTALDNVALPLFYQNISRKQREAKASLLLERMGLRERIHHLPSELSGGQRQRVAIARALVNDSPLILADEPTGNLDSATSDEVMNIFTEINQEGKTLVVITHDEKIAARANRVIYLKDGVVCN